ncbi:MAG: nuclear transport factor 2 family protein [Rhodobacteraceae bacterium]|nr:nuclear transport factor 2 family protein [Paracoccaceae bacterium]
MIGEGEAGRIDALCRAYAAALERGDLDALLACFTEDAVAHSPIFGTLPAAEFYARVLRITGGRRMSVRTVFAGLSDPPRAAIHVRYTRRIEGRPAATIEGVDLFDLSPGLDRFAAVTIVYDTAPVRPDFDDPAGPGR